MTSRERVHAAFRHVEPDRTPLFEREIKPPTDAAILGRPAVHPYNWPGYMGLWADEGWEAAMEGWARDEFEIARRLGFDLVRLMTNPPKDAPQPVRIDGRTFRVGDASYRYHVTSGVVENLSARAVPPEEAEQRFRNGIENDYRSPSIRPDELYVWRRIREFFTAEGLDPAVYVSLYAIPVAALPAFALEWFATEPETIERYYEKQTRYIVDLGRIYVREGAEIVGLGGDFAGDSGPVISPRAYRERVMPYIRRQSDAMHALGAWTTNTTDGDLWSVLPDFLDGAGVDGYGEIDVAAGMDLSRLKREWGDRCTFLGNLDIRHVLCSGTPANARAEMLRCIHEGWGNGGHIIMTSNVVHEDVKPDLYLTAIGAYRDYFGLPPLENARC